MTIRFSIKQKKPAPSCRNHRRPIFNNRAYLYVRIRDGRAIDQTVRTSILVCPHWWNSERESIRTNSACPETEMITVNKAVNELRNHLVADYIADRSERCITGDWLKKEIDGFGHRLRLHGRLDKLSEEFLEGYALSDARRAQYEGMFRILARFERYARELNLDNLTTKGLDRLYEYILTEYEIIRNSPEKFYGLPIERKPRPRSRNTANDIFKKLRTFMGWCVSMGYLDHSPFDVYRIPQEIYGTPFSLTKEELAAIARHRCSSAELEVQKDIFVFQCNVGCRVGDLMRFRSGDCAGDVLSYIPNKTSANNGNTVTVPLNATAKAVVEKYRGGGKLFPYVPLQKYNTSIKRILREAGVTRQVTVLDPLTRKEKRVPICDAASSHLARRTFINLLYHNVKDPALVASMTGHVEGSRAFQRYRAIDDKLKRDLVRMLETK